MTANIRSFRDLVAWQKSMDLCESVYGLARRLPADERFGLASQMRRAAVSVPSNIAEGYGRGRKQDYLRFLRLARGSLAELETQLTLAVRLNMLNGDETGRCGKLMREVERVLEALIRAVRNSSVNER